LIEHGHLIPNRSRSVKRKPIHRTGFFHHEGTKGTKFLCTAQPQCFHHRDNEAVRRSIAASPRGVVAQCRTISVVKSFFVLFVPSL